MSVPEEQAVEVAYALPDRQAVVRVKFVAGMTALGAVEASGLQQSHEELRNRPLDLGIYGRPVSPSELLRDGDRVEIYRPLKADPREVRRRLAAEGRTMGPPGGDPDRR
jgi:uncharacterized protein